MQIKARRAITLVRGPAAVVAAMFLCATQTVGKNKAAPANNVYKSGENGMYRDIVGVCHAKGLYHLTEKDFLNEGADRILELGSRVIKFWLTQGPETPRRLYPWNSEWPDSTTIAATTPPR